MMLDADKIAQTQRVIDGFAGPFNEALSAMTDPDDRDRLLLALLAMFTMQLAAAVSPQHRLKAALVAAEALTDAGVPVHTIVNDAEDGSSADKPN